LTKVNNLSRRGLLQAGAALGAGTMLGGGSALAADRVFVPYSNKSLDFYFFVIQEEAVKRAVLENSWEFQATNANFDNTRQLEQWQSLMLSDPSAIISDPIDSQAIVSAIRRYNQKGIPVGIIDTPADGGDVAITVSFDNFIGGQMAAQEIIKRLTEKHGSPKGTVLNCFGALQSVAWRLRKEGMDAEFAKYPEIKYLARPTEGALDQMLAVTLATLSEFPRVASSRRCSRRDAGRRSAKKAMSSSSTSMASRSR
jgi:simple sugar transport system substrate-binding protein